MKEGSPALEAEVRRQVDVLVGGTAEVLSAAELESKVRRSLATGVPLKVKLGADPSAPDIHIGHSVVLRKLRQFQELGHRVIFIIGDYTGLIGDPSGRSRTRPQLTEDEVRENALTYQEQVFKILDPDLSEVVFNSQWLAPLRLRDLIKLASSYTVARMLERDDFEQRYTTGQPIGLHEFIYPLMQAYDSVELAADVELGGTDQKFNLLMARDIQREYGQEPQVTVLMPLLRGTDGQEKMSKSLGNCIGIADDPGDMFGKLMSIPDDLIADYLLLAVGAGAGEVERARAGLESGELHPREEKARMAGMVVSEYHGEDAARDAAAAFDRVFRDGMAPEDMPAVSLGRDDLDEGTIWVVDLMRRAGACPSNSEGRRLVTGGAVWLDDNRIDDPTARIRVRNGQILKVGKRRFTRISLGP